MATYKSYIDQILTWMTSVVSATATSSGGPPTPNKRPWCWLGLSDNDFDTIKDNFSSQAQAQSYAAEYNTGKLTNNPVSFIQAEGDMIYALQKGFTLRYENRLDHYRNDCEHKYPRVYNTLSHATAKFDLISSTAG